MSSTNSPSDNRAKQSRSYGIFIELRQKTKPIKLLRDSSKTYEVKYPEATRCLEKDRDVLFTFFDFPAEHWSHIRSTNPIESTFATVRLRTKKTRGCVSRESIRSLVFKLIQSAQKRWRRIKGFSLLAEVIEGIEFKDGLRTQDKQQDAA